MTVKLYENSCYLTENRTTVTSCEEKDGKVFITLSETILFPEEGGQNADAGVIIADGKEIRVLHGKLKGEDVIYQVEEAIAPGTEVTCEIDWDVRYMRMQQHTGEHILTGMIHNTFGYDNVGFHLSDTGFVTLDLNGVITPEQANQMEIMANKIIYANMPVKHVYPSKEELKDWSYRSKIEIAGQVRLIVIENDEMTADVCACCAPHVERTGEVGLIKITGIQKYKGGTRISMLAGLRALEFCSARIDILNKVAGIYSTSPDTVIDVINKQKNELAELKVKLAEAATKDLLDKIAKMPESDNGFMVIAEDLGGNSLKDAFNALADKFPGYAGLFIGNDDAGYRFMAGSRKLDTKALSQRMREKLNAKGGGSGEMIQGRLDASKDEIEAFFAEL